MSGRTRKLLVVLAGGGLLLVLVGVAAVLWVRTAVPDRDGEWRVDGLDQPVEVLWDEYAVPQIRAQSLHDAVFAQGFLHARDRLWQMELVRHAVQGRLSELMGEATVETDRFMRRLDLWSAARGSVALMEPDERALLQAYADGINAALTTRAGARPPELLALRHQPEPWEPAHSLAVGKMMSLTLAAYGESVAVARALRRLAPERAPFLFPAFPAWGATILESDSVRPPATPLSATDRRTAPAARAPTVRPPAPSPVPAQVAALVNGFSLAAASNSWVVDGRWTRSGLPLLANDTHLELQAPSLWYLVGLHAPGVASAADLSVVGLSIPGAPLVLIGRNRAIAWGLTNAYVDDVDLFLERVDPEDPGRYLTPDGSAPFEVRTETIQVRGREEPVVMPVRSTRHGPLLPLDPAGADQDTVLAVQWTALRPGTVFRGIIGFNLADDWPSFLAAADDMDDPHQNLVYADTAGHIGFVMGGTVPIRGEGLPAPVAPVPGWTGEWDWRGDLPFDQHPRVLDPAAGFIVTANNLQTLDPLGARISGTWNPPFRAMRIRQMIRDGGEYTAEDMHRMQLDVVDLYAQRYLDRAVEAARWAGLDEEAEQLAGWNGRADPESHAATLFYLWNEAVQAALARDLYGGDVGYFPSTAAGEVLESRRVAWAEDQSGRYREVVRQAMREVAPLADHPWGEANRAVHAHALAEVEVLDRLLGLNIGPHGHYGSPTTVNVAHWGFRSPAESFPFTTTAGPSERQVVDMGNLGATGGFVIGTGQGGVPFDPHYDSQVPLWRDGGLIPMPLEWAAIQARSVQQMLLEPGDGNDG